MDALTLLLFILGLDPETATNETDDPERGTRPQGG
jgi:hypothetical protein